MIVLSKITQFSVVTSVIAALFLGMLTYTPQAHAATSAEIQAMQVKIQQLMQMVMALQSQMAAMQGNSNTGSRYPTVADFHVGDRVQTTAMLKVRSGPGTSYSWVNNVTALTGGKIVNDSHYSDGYNWWLVKYDNGTQGWSAQSWLRKMSSYTSPTLKSNTDVPSCRISTDKNTYVYGEDIVISWTSNNAKYVKFTDFSPKDSLDLPSNRQSKSNDIEVEASVTGMPTIELTAYGEDGISSTCSRRVTVTGPSVTLSVNARDVDYYQINPGDKLDVAYYPKGEIEECTVTGYYESGSRSITHKWDGWVDPQRSNNYGRASFVAAGAYKDDYSGRLEKIKVSCKVDRGSDVTDRTSIEVVDSGERRSYEIEFNGDEMSSGSNASEADVWIACYDAIDSLQYGSPAPEQGDQVDCYWGNERILSVDAWKG